MFTQDTAVDVSSDPPSMFAVVLMVGDAPWWGILQLIIWGSQRYAYLFGGDLDMNLTMITIWRSSAENRD